MVLNFLVSKTYLLLHEICKIIILVKLDKNIETIPLMSPKLKTSLEKEIKFFFK